MNKYSLTGMLLLILTTFGSGHIEGQSRPGRPGKAAGSLTRKDYARIFVGNSITQKLRAIERLEQRKVPYRFDLLGRVYLLATSDRVKAEILDFFIRNRQEKLALPGLWVISRDYLPLPTLSRIIGVLRNNDADYEKTFQTRVIAERNVPLFHALLYYCRETKQKIKGYEYEMVTSALKDEKAPQTASILLFSLRYREQAFSSDQQFHDVFKKIWQADEMPSIYRLRKKSTVLLKYYKTNPALKEFILQKFNAITAQLQKKDEIEIEDDQQQKAILRQRYRQRQLAGSLIQYITDRLSADRLPELYHQGSFLAKYHIMRYVSSRPGFKVTAEQFYNEPNPLIFRYQIRGIANNPAYNGRVFTILQAKWNTLPADGNTRISLLKEMIRLFPKETSQMMAGLQFKRNSNNQNLFLLYLKEYVRKQKPSALSKLVVRYLYHKNSHIRKMFIYNMSAEQVSHFRGLLRTAYIDHESEDTRRVILQRLLGSGALKGTTWKEYLERDI